METQLYIHLEDCLLQKLTISIRNFISWDIEVFPFGTQSSNFVRQLDLLLENQFYGLLLDKQNFILGLSTQSHITLTHKNAK